MSVTEYINILMTFNLYAMFRLQVYHGCFIQSVSSVQSVVLQLVRKIDTHCGLQDSYFGMYRQSKCIHYTKLSLVSAHTTSRQLHYIFACSFVCCSSECCCHSEASGEVDSALVNDVALEFQTKQPRCESKTVYTVQHIRIPLVNKKPVKFRCD